MPIEILEMLVKATVLENRSESEQEKEQQPAQTLEDREQLVRDVIAQVMEILQYQKER